MAAITQATRHEGAVTVIRAYAAVDAPVLYSRSALDLHVCYAQLTGNMTINVDNSKLQQFQEVSFYFSSDASNRTVTFGTGFVVTPGGGLTGSSLSIPASSDAIVKAIYDGTALRIAGIHVQGRGTTLEQPAYAATLEITDQAATRHIFFPAQLTGALTVNATNLTKAILGDEYVFHFQVDGTQRIVTFGTNILSSGTITIPANKTATARGFFNGTNICISNREISA